MPTGKKFVRKKPKNFSKRIGLFSCMYRLFSEFFDFFGRQAGQGDYGFSGQSLRKSLTNYFFQARFYSFLYPFFSS